jgi:hypothetical protein
VAVRGLSGWWCSTRKKAVARQHQNFLGAGCAGRISLNKRVEIVIMEYQIIAKVIGARNSVGKFVDKSTGESVNFDSTTIFVNMDMEAVSEKNGDGERNAVGVCGEEYKAKDHRLFHKLAGKQFPVECELLFKRVSNGKEQRDELVDIRPRGAVKAG